MANKYLEKIAEFNQNINYNYHVDEYNDKKIKMLDDIYHANSILSSKGYRPSLNESVSDAVKAEKMIDLETKSWHRPNHNKSVGKSLLGGVVTGLAAGGIAAATRQHVPAVAVGLGTGALAANIIHRISYNKEKRKADESSMEAGRRSLLEHLNKHYVKE